jgi:nucleoid-associated protein YgaU
VTREQKLALIVGFSLILFVGVLISDHLSSARKAKIAKVEPETATAPLTVAQIPPPGPAPESHAAAPAIRDAALDLIIPPSPTTLANPPVAAANPAPESAPVNPAPSTIAVRTQDPALDEEIRRLGGKLEQGPDGIPTIKLPPAMDVVTKPTVSTVPPIDPAPQTRKTIATPIGPIQPLKTHEVRAGDTLFQITQRYYGNGNLWRDLAKFNNMDRAGTVRVGSRLKIPSRDVLLGKSTTLTSNPDAGVRLLRPTENTPKAPPPKAAPSRDRAAPKIDLASYTVQKGDTLGVISQRKLGSAKRWQEIADLNNLDDEDAISAGTVLKLPAKRS